MTNPDPWLSLEREFDAWRAAGRTVTLWLRDDDACRPGPRLSRLLTLTAAIPLGLAAIPTRMEPALADAVAPYPHARVLQHGFAHRNHAPAGEKKAEFGAHRPIAEMRDEVRAGWQRIRDLFPDRAVEIFVPPWNRIAPELVGMLPGCGPALLSIYGARTTGQGADRVNTHVDIIAWRGTRGFVGEEAALGALLGHLRARRAGTVDPAEPTGILTHHGDHDAECWVFIERLLERSLAHPAVHWLDPSDLAGSHG